MIRKDLDLTLRRMDARDVSEPTVVGDSGAPSPEAGDEMDDDDILMQNIDEQTLRRIFHGLCRD